MLCALLLASEGYKVAVLERTEHPGGRYTSIDKNGYTINTGSWSLELHGTNGPLYRLLSELGAKIEVRAPKGGAEPEFYQILQPLDCKEQIQSGMIIFSPPS